MSRKKRIIKAHLFEDERVCEFCDKPLSGDSGMIYTIVPSSNLIYEYCSWRCMYVHTKDMLTKAAESNKILGTDLIGVLGYERIWDDTNVPELSPEELEAPIDDPR